MNRLLGYSPGAAKPAAVTNQRKGKGAKTVLTEDGPICIEVPRDRDGSSEPPLIPEHERCLTGFDEKIVAMYAGRMTVRGIRTALSRSGRDQHVDVQGSCRNSTAPRSRPSSLARLLTRSWPESWAGSHGHSFNS